MLGYRNTDNQTGVFDGGIVVLAMFTLSLFHPGMLLRGPDELKAVNKKVRYWESQSSTIILWQLDREIVLG
jgi:hypothetical protein